MDLQQNKVRKKETEIMYDAKLVNILQIKINSAD